MSRSIEDLRRKLVETIDAQWPAFVKAWLAEHPERPEITPLQRLELNLRDAVERCREGIGLVPWNPREELPGAVSPGQVVQFSDSKTDGMTAFGGVKMDRQIAAASVIHRIDSAELLASLEELLLTFRGEVEKRGIDLRWARPLPHVPPGWAAYMPVLVDGAPCRLIASWSHLYRGWALSLDTIVPSGVVPEPGWAPRDRDKWVRDESGKAIGEVRPVVNPEIPESAMKFDRPVPFRDETTESQPKITWGQIREACEGLAEAIGRPRTRRDEAPLL